MAEQTSAPRRRQPFNLWILAGGAIVLHLIVAAILSPGLFLGEDDSPDALVKKARALRENGQYQQAMEIYSTVVRQKPPVPAIFEEAEKEMQETRIQALNAEREAAEKAAQQEAARKTAKEDQTDNQPPAAAAATTPDKPVSDLPALPSIGDEL